jgi:hypothetical protein
MHGCLAYWPCVDIRLASERTGRSGAPLTQACSAGAKGLATHRPPLTTAACRRARDSGTGNFYRGVALCRSPSARLLRGTPSQRSGFPVLAAALERWAEVHAWPPGAGDFSYKLSATRRTPNGRAPAAETACSEGNLGVGHQARARAGTMIAVSLPAPYLGHHANLGSSHHVGGQFPSRRHYEHPRIYVRGRLS